MYIYIYIDHDIYIYIYIIYIYISWSCFLFLSVVLTQALLAQNFPWFAEAKSAGCMMNSSYFQLGEVWPISAGIPCFMETIKKNNLRKWSTTKIYQSMMHGSNWGGDITGWNFGGDQIDNVLYFLPLFFKDPNIIKHQKTLPILNRKLPEWFAQSKYVLLLCYPSTYHLYGSI